MLSSPAFCFCVSQLFYNKTERIAIGLNTVSTQFSVGAVFTFASVHLLRCITRGGSAALLSRLCRVKGHPRQRASGKAAQ